MKRDAEAHAAEDKKRREVVDLKNRADAMILQTKKALEEHGGKISPEGRSKVENAISGR
jgi:molecular chaperone DnaK